MLDGFDAEHPLKMTFDNVMLDAPASIKTTASHAMLTLGPGPVNFRPDGEGVTVSGIPAAGSPILPALESLFRSRGEAVRSKLENVFGQIPLPKGEGAAKRRVRGTK